MKQKKKYKKALKKIMKLAKVPTSETPQQRIKRLKGIAEKALFITDVVVPKGTFYCFEESINMQLKCDSECDYCKAIKKTQ